MYEILKSEEFDAWFEAQDNTIQKRIKTRIELAEDGHFGQHEYERDGISVMKFKTIGIRLYYCQIEDRVYLLLTGGDKNTKKEQTRDIDRAIKIKEKELGQ